MNHHVNRRSLFSTSAAVAAVTVSGEALANAKASGAETLAAPRATIEDVTNHYQAAFESYSEALDIFVNAEIELDSVEVGVVCPAFENWRREHRCETDDEIDAATQPDWYEIDNCASPLQQERARKRAALRQSLKAELASRRLGRRAAEERLGIDALRRRADAAEDAEREARIALLIHVPADLREAAIKREFVTSSVFFKDDWCRSDRVDFIVPLLLALCAAPACGVGAGPRS